jgi:hypothetical protein
LKSSFLGVTGGAALEGVATAGIHKKIILIANFD